MKYLFKYMPDEHGDGFIRKYIEGVSTVTGNRYRLEIDYDLCAPVETWTIKKYYGGGRDLPVYHGRELTPEQVDMMVDLVMESEYINFGEFISQ